jgi:hypothetical protein
MISDFSFSWNGRKWSGYFNAIANETVIAHFEDEHIRDMIGNKVAYSKTGSGTVAHAVPATIPEEPAGIYDAIRKGVEVQLGKTLQHYLN